VNASNDKTGDGYIDQSAAERARHEAWAGHHDCSGTGEGERARAQYEKDKLGPGPHCWNCGGKITHEQAERNGGTLCDDCKAAQPEAGTADRIAEHPMYSPSDLKYLRGKGYSDAEILAFWDRDHGLGCKPVQHRLTYDGTPREVLREALRDSLSPQAVAAIAAHLHGLVHTKSDAVNRQVAWFTEQLLDMVGDQYNALCEEAGL